MKDAGIAPRLINAPADLPMDEETPWGRRADLTVREFVKINEYQRKGDVASFEEGTAYLRSL